MKIFRKKSIEKIIQEHDSGDLHGESHGLNKILSARDLTFLGIAAIIGAGSFSSMGTACASGGPGVILLFILCGIACGFTALCYAEFASRIPVSGSAYTYAYASFGELFAWVIGWALLMEYSIGNIYVAFSWSGYFTNLLDLFGLHLPEWLSCNYLSAASAKSGEGLLAWQNAPMINGFKIILDLPAILINVIITWLVYKGVKESRNATNYMVYIKLGIIALVIILGFFYIDINNWTPFMPKGFNGVMLGVSSVFFAYIGFDAISTMAEESKNPQRDLPRGMIYSLIICTIIYILLAIVLTGIVSFEKLGVNDPLAVVWEIKEVKWMIFLISICAVVAMTSVLLVFQMGQPRIWMSMSRDGLLPKKFQEIHPKYQTPSFATILTGLIVGIPILFTNEKFILDFTSIGTLFAFVLVCGGVLLLPPQDESQHKDKFKLPYINGQYIYPIIVIGSIIFIAFTFTDYFTGLFQLTLQDTTGMSIEEINESTLSLKTLNISTIIFWSITIVLAIFAYVRKWSLIPLLGLVSCLYLLTGMAASNWFWFMIWLLIGLVLYFLYGYKKSKLNIA